MEVEEGDIFPVSDDNGTAGDTNECDEGCISPTPVTVPKKRGRPAHSEKPKKIVIPSRGRGKPSKSDGNGHKPASKIVDDSDEEDSGSDVGGPSLNGNSAEAPKGVALKRGRKPKAKRKLNHTIDKTGKGRGRPKKIPKADDGEDEHNAANNHDAVSSDYKSGKKASGKTAKKGRGRPKKVQSEDDSSDEKLEDDEERRPVGRPSSGGVNLNIVATGKGQGRPKKKVAEKRAADAAKRSGDTENGDAIIKKPRGRPASKKTPYVSTGKPRGRPKLSAVQEKDSQDDDVDDDDDEDENGSDKVAENSEHNEEENENTKEMENDNDHENDNGKEDSESEDD